MPHALADGTDYWYCYGMGGNPTRILLALAAVLSSLPLRAQTVTVVTVSPMALGNVASAANGTTIFRVDPSGTVTRESGAGSRVSQTSTRSTVTIRCSTPNSSNKACDTTSITLKIAPGASTKRLDPLKRFAVSSMTGTTGATIPSPPVPADTITFTVDPIGRNTNKSFYVGADFHVRGDESGLDTGSADASFLVSIESPSSTSTGTGINTATVYRSLSVQKNSDLNFGSILPPASGTTTISMAADSNTLSRGTAMAYGTATRASFGITGEPGRIISITVSPASFNMTRVGGTETIPVTTTRSTAGTVTLDTAGAGSFGVGGSFPVSSTTVKGSYTGSFSVTFQYN